MDKHDLTAVVRELTNAGAKLDLGGQTITWPTHELPPDLKQGDEVSLRLLTQAALDADRHENARTILTEILGGNP